MTPYEFADLSQSFFANSLSAYAVFLSIVSGFLATAYMVGAKLTKFQVRMLTALFSLVMVFLIWTMSAYTFWGVEFAMAAQVQGDAGHSLGFQPRFWVPVVFALINVFTAVMCLVFLRNVRHPK